MSGLFAAPGGPTADLVSCGCLALEDADRFLDDRRQLFEIGDEGDELLVSLRVGGEAQTLCGESGFGGADQGLDVGNDRRQAGDERLRERLFSLEDLFDPGGDAYRVLDRSGKPLAKVRDTNPELLKEITHSKFPLKQI